MKTLSLIILTLLTLTACGDSATPEEKAEAEARLWIIDASIEVMKPAFEASDITSVSAEEWVEACISPTYKLVPGFGEPDFYQQMKADYINDTEPSTYGEEVDGAMVRFMTTCTADLLTPQEFVRSGFIGD
jgi:hypothetical protein